MSLLKSIVIGCDDTVTLSTILNNIQETPGFVYNIISAARTSDLVSIAKSLDPDLVILCFRNNQVALNDFELFTRKAGTPVLCLARRGELEKLTWAQNRIVFAYAAEFIAQSDYLASRIHSIFLLRGNGGSVAVRNERGAFSNLLDALDAQVPVEPRYIPVRQQLGAFSHRIQVTTDMANDAQVALLRKDLTTFQHNLPTLLKNARRQYQLNRVRNLLPTKKQLLVGSLGLLGTGLSVGYYKGWWGGNG